MIRVYQDSIPFFGEGRDQATLLALGQVLGDNYFVHPVSDLSAAAGIPADTSVVLITSNGAGFPDTATAENDPAAQANLDAFVQAGGTLIVNMGDNLGPGGFIAPGAVGTPDLIFPFPEDGNATLAPAALGHPIVNGPDGMPGTGDDLTNSNIDMCCSVAHGNLLDGITLPGGATVLMTASFEGGERPILAEYAYGSGRIILDTLTKEFGGHQPAGNGVSFFLRNLLHYGLQLPPPTPPANDDFDSATAVTEPLPFVDEISTLFATTAVDDPSCFGNNATVWYQFTPTQNVEIVALTAGSRFDTTVSAYTGSRGNLTQIACDQPRVTFDAIAGTTYYFAIGALEGTLGGHLKFTVMVPVPTQVNVNITGGSVTRTGVATIRGTIECSFPVSVSMNLELVQRFIRSFARGFNSTGVECTGNTPWSVMVESFTSTIYGPGRADASVAAFFTDPVTGQGRDVNTSRKVSLRRSR